MNYDYDHETKYLIKIITRYFEGLRVSKQYNEREFL